MQLFLYRHGETEWSRLGKHTGLTDIPLTEKGRDQARALHEGIDFDKVYVSPLRRARETCILAGYEGVVDSALLEWDYGKYEGLTSKEISDPKWGLFFKGCPGGESPADVRNRIDPFLQRLEKGKRIALFSSGHVLRALAARWLGLDIAMGAHLSLSTGSKSILGFEHNIPTILLWNDISHLKTLG